MPKIPVSVIVVTRNEEARIVRCLQALQGFSEIWVVDSASTDNTVALAQKMNAKTRHFMWDGRYPKKRQWCLDHLPLAYDWVFFVDADEIVTPDLLREIAALDYTAAGYFVRARYVWAGRELHHGLKNNKLALFNRKRMAFPVVNDLDLPGMGEVEGHYQPVLKQAGKIGQLRSEMLHMIDDVKQWQTRHERYARWEAGMNARSAWPTENSIFRNLIKKIFRALPMRGAAAFAHSYFIRGGWRDGRAGFDFARARGAYYSRIAANDKARARPSV
ncbi:MAG: glycosyltransferase family 2 protein [Alphaproteobacteria bacterium]|nr:glycosyltransferase family 2 protein [Alphaproteobacteria bacterium]